LPLVNILFPAPTSQGLEEWAFHNWQHSKLVRAELAAKKNIQVDLTNIYPFNPNAPDVWLQAEQSFHNSMNAALNTIGVDLSETDFSDKKQADAFFWSHFNEHRNWEQRLGS